MRTPRRHPSCHLVWHLGMGHVSGQGATSDMPSQMTCGCALGYSRYAHQCQVWLLVDAYLLIVGSSWIDEGAGTAWTVYPPLSLTSSHAGLSVDVFLISLHAAGGSSLTGAVNMICTVSYARRVHSTLLQASLYPWAVACCPADVLTASA